jgi:hypothetical protein
MFDFTLPNRRRVAFPTLRYAFIRRSLLGAAVSLAVCALAAGSAGASVPYSGTIQCLSTAPVVGVWVAPSGYNGFFTPFHYSGFGSGPIYRYTFSATRPVAYSLHIGCGGKASSWAKPTYTPVTRNTSATWLCNDIPGNDLYDASGEVADGFCAGP